MYFQSENAQHVLENYCHDAHFITLKWAYILIYAGHFTYVENVHFIWLSTQKSRWATTMPGWIKDWFSQMSDGTKWWTSSVNSIDNIDE